MNIKFLLKKNFFNLVNLYRKKEINFENNIVIKSENKNWVLNQIANEYKEVFQNFTKKVSLKEQDAYISNEVHLFIMSKYYALENLKNFKNKIYFPYFHGSTDDVRHRQSLKIIKKNIESISKIQISDSLMENIFLENKIPKEKFKKIPITIDIKKFKQVNSLDSNQLRIFYELPISSFIIGSFQKDGDGWGKGDDPKMIKGPDIFIKTIKILKDKVPELFVLLTGPSRGYVIKELNKIKVPFKHIHLEKYSEMIKLYKCLNVYLVSSREEGGPRAILESFASKIPLVTTNVGQAVDMVENGYNAFKSNNLNEEELADHIYNNIYYKNTNLQKIINNAYQTVENNTYEKQTNLWKDFFNMYDEK